MLKDMHNIAINKGQHHDHFNVIASWLLKIPISRHSSSMFSSWAELQLERLWRQFGHYFLPLVLSDNDKDLNLPVQVQLITLP